jgi:hypothetical protein
VPSPESCKQCGNRRIDHNDKKLKHTFELDEIRILWFGWRGFRPRIGDQPLPHGRTGQDHPENPAPQEPENYDDIYVRANQSDKEAGMKKRESTLASVRCTPIAPQIDDFRRVARQRLLI